MMIGGIIMSATGGLAVIAGIVELAAAEPLCDAFGSRNFKGETCISTYEGIGIAGMIVGGVLVAIGLPLAIHGAGRVPQSSARASPSLRLGERDAALRWTF